MSLAASDRVVEELREPALSSRRRLPQVREAAGESRSQRLPAIWNVPFLRNPNFTGRDALLDELHKKLTDGRVALTAVRRHGRRRQDPARARILPTLTPATSISCGGCAPRSRRTLLEDYAALAEPLGIGKAERAI